MVAPPFVENGLSLRLHFGALLRQLLDVAHRGLEMNVGIDLVALGFHDVETAACVLFHKHFPDAYDLAGHLQLLLQAVDGGAVGSDLRIDFADATVANRHFG